MKNNINVYLKIIVLFNRAYCRFFEILFYACPAVIRRSMAHKRYDKIGQSWALRNDEPLGSYPPVRGGHFIGQVEFQELIPIFEDNKLLSLLANESTAFVQIGASSGKDIAYFSRNYPKPSYFSTDIAEGAKDYAQSKYGKGGRINFSVCASCDVSRLFEIFDEKIEEVVILVKGVANYIFPEDIGAFFDQFNTQQYRFHLYLMDSNREDKNTGKTIFGPMRYGSYSHDCYNTAVSNGFKVRSLQVWQSHETGGGDARVFLYATNH